jgi:hypothetical protein
MYTEPINLNLYTRILLCLGSGPRTQRQVQEFRETLAVRYQEANSKIDWTKAHAYVERINDRFINKARGLLTCNGLTVTAIGTLYGANIPPLLAWSILLAILSACTLLYSHFMINFHPIEIYGNAKSDYERYTIIIVTRSKYLTIAAIMSLCSIILLPGIKLFQSGWNF